MKISGKRRGRRDFNGVKGNEQRSVESNMGHGIKPEKEYLLPPPPPPLLLLLLVHSYANELYKDVRSDIFKYCSSNEITLILSRYRAGLPISYLFSPLFLFFSFFFPLSISSGTR